MKLIPHDRIRSISFHIISYEFSYNNVCYEITILDTNTIVNDISNTLESNIK